MQEGELVVKDGWDKAREGIALSSFGPSWTAEKLGRKLGEYQPVPTDIFSQVGTPGRYDPEAINVDIRPEKNKRYIPVQTLMQGNVPFIFIAMRS